MSIKDDPKMKELLKDMKMSDNVKQNHRRYQNSSLHKKVRFKKALMELLINDLIEKKTI